MAQFAAPRKDQRPVLRHLGLAIGAGEALRVRGPNGAGKTALLRMLAGLLPATGQILLDGVALARHPEAHVERIARAGHLDAIKPADGGREPDLLGGAPRSSASAFSRLASDLVEFQREVQHR